MTKNSLTSCLVTMGVNKLFRQMLLIEDVNRTLCRILRMTIHCFVIKIDKIGSHHDTLN